MQTPKGGFTLRQLREEFNLSQVDIALALGLKQSTVSGMERVDNDPRLSTLKRYVEVMGGRLSLLVELPEGSKRVVPISLK